MNKVAKELKARRYRRILLIIHLIICFLLFRRIYTSHSLVDNSTGITGGFVLEMDVA